MDREWKLGKDLHPKDSLLDGFTFEQLILALHSGSRTVDQNEVCKVAKEILESHLEDMWFLIGKNMNEIIAEAMKGRSR